jgi:hypothetical protein
MAITATVTHTPAPKASRKAPAGKGHNKPPVSAGLPQDVQAALMAYVSSLSGMEKAKASLDTAKGTAETRLLALLMNDAVWNFRLKLSLSKGRSTSLRICDRAELDAIPGGAAAYWDAARALFGVPSDLKASFKVQFLNAYALANVARKEKVSVTIDGKVLNFKAPTRNASPLAKSLQGATNFSKAVTVAKATPVKPKGAKTGGDAKASLNIDGAASLLARYADLLAKGGAKATVPAGDTLDNLRLAFGKLKPYLD